MKLTAELIYDAALDDELFGELPRIIAQSLDARSCVLHWRDQAGTAEIAAHSGYFSDQQMVDYAANFAEHDLWTEAGMRHGFANKAWKTSELVPAHAYERSLFYNEWIRAMGDDTFHCCGSVMRTEDGDGIIGLHRGKGQTDFSEVLLDELNGHVHHLRRMFAVRARIGKLAARSDLLGAIFAHSGNAAFALGIGGRLLLANAGGDAALRSGHFLVGRGGHVRPVVDSCRAEFDAALAAAISWPGPSASTCLLRSRQGAVVIASLMPLPSSLAEPAALVTIDDGGAALAPATLAMHVQQAFGLSPAEADIALRLAEGAALRAISEQRGSAIDTVRTQVKSILMKMDAQRQSDIVRIVGALGRGQPASGSSPSTIGN